MLLAVEVVVVAAIVFAVAALAVGRFDRMEPAPPDAASDGLPDGPLTPSDVVDARFGMTLRGYRMAEVDTVLERLAWEMARRDAEIARLSGSVRPTAARPPSTLTSPPETSSPLAAPSLTSPSLSSPSLTAPPAVEPSLTKPPRTPPEPPAPPEVEPTVDAPRTGGLFRASPPSVAAELFRPAAGPRADPTPPPTADPADPAESPLPRRQVGVREHPDRGPGAGAPGEIG